MKTVSVHYICDQCSNEIDVAVDPGLLTVEFTAPRVFQKPEKGEFCSVACAALWFHDTAAAHTE